MRTAHKLLSCILLICVAYEHPACAASPPGPTTPTSLKVTVKSLELGKGLIQVKFEDHFDLNTTIDVVSSTSQTDNLFGSIETKKKPYRGIRMAMKNTALYSGTDPCTGAPVTGATILFPRHDPGLDAASDEFIIQLEVPNQVRGTSPGAQPMKSFDLGDDPVNLSLVFPVTNSIVCLSDDDPLRSISGTDTALSAPLGLYEDTLNNEIGVTNGTGNTVTIYKRGASGNVFPVRILEGQNTQLDIPFGIVFDHDPLDPANDMIAVSNSKNDTITFYPRTCWGNGNLPPARTLGGSATQLDNPGMIYIHDGELGVANSGEDNSLTFYRLADIFDTTTFPDGNVPPVRVISGDNTGLASPCGIHLDTDNDEVLVANGGIEPTLASVGGAVVLSSGSRAPSLTIYRRDDNGNVAPQRTISGDQTELDNPCGVDIDTVNDEIVVASNGNRRVNFYPRTATGDVPPVRAIRGILTGLEKPVDVHINQSDKVLLVTNSLGNRLTVHRIDTMAAHLAQAPVLKNSAAQQSLTSMLSYSGKLDRNSGEPLSIEFDGYRFVWTINDDTLTNEGDATNAILFPPSDITFELTDGSTASNLEFTCPNFTPFTMLTRITNCEPPLISAPFPPQPASYRIASLLFGAIDINRHTYRRSSLRASQLPRLLPNLTLAADNTIQKIDWRYTDPAGNPLPDGMPLLASQQAQIQLNQRIFEVSPCYKLIANPTTVYQSGGLTQDVRTITDIQNNNCPVSLDDVATITFSAIDAFGNSAVYSWEPE